MKHNLSRVFIEGGAKWQIGGGKQITLRHVIVLMDVPVTSP
jgi:hypothetical protein